MILQNITLTLVALLMLVPVSVRAQDSAAPDPEQLEFMIFEGGLYVEEGKYREAVELLREVVAFAPDRFDARLSYARALTRGLLSGQFQEPMAVAQEAFAQYQWILEHEPDAFQEHEAQRTIELLNATYLREEEIPLETDAGREAWQEAREAVQAGDPDRAIRALKRAIRVEPESAAAHKALGLALLQDDQTREGRKEMRRAANLDPDDPETRTVLGQITEESGNSEDALEQYEKALLIENSYAPAAQGIIRILEERELDSLNGDELTMLGMAQVTLNRHEQAIVTLERAIVSGAGSQARKTLAIAEFLMGNDTRVITLLEEVRVLLPEDLETLYYLGAANLRMGRLEPGRDHLRELLVLDPGNPNALRLLGLSLADEPGRAEEAIEYLLRADRNGARINNLSCILGTLYMQTGDGARAEQMFSDCLASNPDFASAFLGLGILADERGETRTASDHFQRYLELDPEPERAAVFRLGVAYLRSGQDQKGYDALRELVEADSLIVPEDSTGISETRLLEATSFFLAAARRYDDAIFIGEMLLTRDSENAIYNNNLAMTYADANQNLGRAHALALKANRLSPDNPGHLDTLGWAYLRMGQYEEAETTFMKSIELAGGEGRTDISEIYYHLGYLYHLTERNEEAEQFLTRALENPPTPFLQQEIERLLDQVGTEKP